MMTAPGAVKIEGKVIYPAKVEGFVDVYSLPKFVLAKARWMDDEEVSSCFLCKNKFGPIRRKHHCRACGNIFCKNCCNEKYILPHLGFKKPERVCELCQPVTGLLAKSCSDQQSVIVEAAADLSEMLQESRNIAKGLFRNLHQQHTVHGVVILTAIIEIHQDFIKACRIEDVKIKKNSRKDNRKNK